MTELPEHRLPKVVRVYIRQVAVGFAIAAVFVAGLLALDVAHLRHLVMADKAGWIAVLMLWVFNGIVFAGVQFAITIMREQDDDDDRGGPGGGLGAVAPERVPGMVPELIPARAGTERGNRRFVGK